MDAKAIRSALAAVGKQLPPTPKIELLIVGGAAGLLNGELGGAYVTGDVDALVVLPPEQWDQLQTTAADVGAKMELPANWLNRDAGLFAYSLPRDWERRRFDVGHFDALQVWAIGRQDLIAMKFCSHRPVDRMHLNEMKVTPSDREFVLRYLDDLVGFENQGAIDMARYYVKNWPEKP